MERFERVLYVEEGPGRSGRGPAGTGEVAGLPHARCRVAAARDTRTVLREVEERAPDLVVKVEGSARPPWSPHLDPADRELLRRCPRPVWLLPRGDDRRVEVVLAAVDVGRDDAGALNEWIVRVAASLAERPGAHLHVVHAWSVPGESILASPLRGVSRPRLRSILAHTRRERRRALEQLLERAAPGREATIGLPKGPAVPALRREARRIGADVVVVGNSARSGAEAWLLGNVVEALVGRVPGSVLALPATFLDAPEVRTVRRTRSGRTAVSPSGTGVTA